MAKFRSRTTKKRRFGMASGMHSVNRRATYVKTHKYRYAIRRNNKKSQPNGSSKLIIFRKNMLRKYVIGKARRAGLNRTLFEEDKSSSYCMNRVSSDEPFKFRITRNSPVSNEGYRLVSLDSLQNTIGDITIHAATCSGIHKLTGNDVAPIRIVKEVRTCGLAAVLLMQCQGCEKTFTFTTSPQLHTDSSHHYDVNVRAVWGSMATGSGVAQLNESMSTLNAPGMSQHTFTSIEQEIGDMWGKVVLEDLLAAGAEERRIAMEKGRYHQGFPCITVICDGGWSKRSHKHTYNALGGVAIIIGAETGKLLYIGVRNKCCYICDRANSSNTAPKPHRCFKNWSESSQAMESDIILEGFLKAETMHGLHFTELIGDGDSSVYAKISQQVPWGRDVKKIECANHACKCLRSNLEKLVQENPLYKGKNRLTKAMRVRLTSAVRCAIRMRAMEQDKQKAVKLLQHDIRNCIYHILGNHTNCSDFCKSRPRSDREVSDSQCDAVDDQCCDSDQTASSLACSMENASMMWTESSSLEAEQESRCASSDTIDIDELMLHDINKLLDRMACKSDRLLANSTTNLAESWMAVRAKFDGGKMYNRCNRGSWTSRCYGGCLRSNFGPKWSPAVWEKTTGSKAGHYFQQLYRRREVALSSSAQSKQKPEIRARRWKRKYKAGQESSSKRARKEYGTDSLDVVPELSGEELKSRTENFLKTQIDLSNDTIIAIERSTTDQSSSSVWLKERKKRLTASNFGRVVKRNPSIPVKKLVGDLLYSQFKGNRHTLTGSQQEAMSVKEYITRKAEENQPVTVTKMGLCISPENKFLAASPDGKVTTEDGEIGLFEVKNLLHSKPLNLTEAAKEVKNFCLEMNQGSLSLKRNHDYYYQVQGQLNVTNVGWADFMVRTVNPYQIHIERIAIDRELWSTVMLPKLKAFYDLALLPEIIHPMYNTTSGIREPGVWFQTSKAGKSRRCQAIASGAATSKRSRQKVKTATCSQQPRSPKDQFTQPSTSTQKQSSRTRRLVRVKFVGRRISHRWIGDEGNNKRAWHSGIVCELLSGRDGEASAAYEVLYDGEEESVRVDHLVEDYRTSSVKFIDI